MPTWTRTVALVREHAALSAAIAPDGAVPSVYACYRFTAKLRANEDMLAACIARVTVSLSERLPEYGRNVAIDGSDMPAYANGQRFKYNHDCSKQLSGGDLAGQDQGPGCDPLAPEPAY